MLLWLPLIINGIISLLLMVLHISGINFKKPRIVLAWLILASIQFFLEIVFIIVLFNNEYLYKEYYWLVLAFILKPLSQLITLILTGLHYKNMKNAQWVPMQDLARPRSEIFFSYYWSGGFLDIPG